MASRLLKPQTTYSRILLSDGSTLSHTDGKLNVTGEFTTGNLQVNGADVSDVNPIHVELVGPSSIAVTDNGASLTVDASALDIRALTTDDQVTVSASDLDIRALDYSTDAVKALPHINSAVLYTSEATSSVSASFDTIYCKTVSFAGVVSDAVTFDIEVSSDDSNWYSSGTQMIMSVAGDFHATFETAFQYVRLNPSGSVTATVVASCI